MTSMTKQWVAKQSPPNKPTVTVRPIQPGDADLINEMHQRLSPDSIYYRYLQARIPSIAEIEQVCRLDPAKGAGFVATAQRGAEIIVGVAYYVREPQAEGPTAEPGILIEDQFQGQGIGRRLWQQLHEHAKANQIRWLRVLFNPNNYRVLRLLQESGFAYQAQANWWLNEYLVALGEPPHQSRWQRVFNHFGLLLAGQAGSYLAAPIGTYANYEPVWLNHYHIYLPAG